MASVGVDVIVGSRSNDRAARVCDAIRDDWPQRGMWLEPGQNVEAAKAQIVVVATPWDAAAPTAESVAGELEGKVVISMANALEKRDGELRAITPPSGERCSSVGRSGSTRTRSVASKSAPSRFDAVSSGPITRKFLLSALSFITSRKNCPITRVASASTVAGLGTATA